MRSLSLKCFLLLLVAGLTVPASAKESVMFLSAHPDDIISSLGTCLLMRDKFDIHVVDFTHGERGLGEKGFLDGSTKARRNTMGSDPMATQGRRRHLT